MDVKILQHDEKSIVCISGRLDTLTAPAFQDELENLIERGMARIILDFSDLEYLSSAGLRSTLIIAQKTKNANGQVVCCQLKGLVKKVFEISKFAEIVPTVDTVEDALERI
ncbi:MAG: STAS domain-containing protein [Desulfomonilaceae bacterium]|jgi:anti-sigma B factor antagonist